MNHSNLRITIPSAAMPTAGEAAQEEMAYLLCAEFERRYPGADVRVRRYGRGLSRYTAGGWDDLPPCELRDEIETFYRAWLDRGGGS